MVGAFHDTIGKHRSFWRNVVDTCDWHCCPYRTLHAAEELLRLFGEMGLVEVAITNPFLSGGGEYRGAQAFGDEDECGPAGCRAGSKGVRAMLRKLRRASLGRSPVTADKRWFSRVLSEVLLPDEVQGHLTSHYAAALELMPSPSAGRSRLLELGAGHCEVAQMLRVRGWNVHAADIEDSCVAEATALGFPSTRLDLNEPLPFSDGSFDFVVMLEVIEHVVRAEAALGEVARVLSPGGRLLLTTPNHAFYKSRLRMLKGRPLGMEGDHVRFFRGARAAV